MYAKSTRPSVKRDDQIARPRRAQTCARGARRECAREAGRFFNFSIVVRSLVFLLDLEVFWYFSGRI